MLSTACLPTSENQLMDAIAERQSPILEQILSDPIQYDCQIIYEQIDRDSLNRPSFTRYKMYLNDGDYFYPASTVKMPLAFLALEKARALDLDPNWTVEIDSARYPQSPFKYDSTSLTGQPNLNQWVKNVFLYSDNNSSNRLYEFLGQGYLHDQLKSKGLTKTQINHRLGDPRFGHEENRYTNPYRVLHPDGQVAFEQEEQVAELLPPLEMKNLVRGSGYMNAEERIVYEAFDFSTKNYFPLSEQLDVLKRVYFPEVYSESERFSLQPEDYTSIYKAMGMRPRESKAPKLDSTEYYDSYVKLLIAGDNQEHLPDHLRIFNKIGWAYGFLTDVAYVVDTENNVEFLLAATVHVNENGIYNDGQYEYDEEGVPFLAELGRAVYEFELKNRMKAELDLDKYLVDFKD